MKQGQDYPGVTVVYFCHDEENNFIMNKRSINCRDEHGRWDIGGGGVDFGDSVVGTLEKEIQEEYCTKVLKHEFLGFRDLHRKHDGNKTHWIALDYKVLIDKTTVRNGEPHKFDEVSWFRLNKMPDKLHSQLPDFLERYQDKLI